MRRLGRIAVVVMAAIIGASGCGDDGGDDSGAAPGGCRVVEIRPPDPYPTMPTDDESLERTVAESFCSNFSIGEASDPFTYEPVLSSRDAQCIADRLGDQLGTSRLRELWRRPGPWHLLLFVLGSAPSGIERAEAEQIAETFEHCSPAWKLLLINSVTEGADEMSAESASCASSELSDDDARRVLIGELDRAYDDPSQPDAQPFTELIEPLIEAFEACLTPAELDGLDWN